MSSGGCEKSASMTCRISERAAPNPSTTDWERPWSSCRTISRTLPFRPAISCTIGIVRSFEESSITRTSPRMPFSKKTPLTASMIAAMFSPR
jgi:hypothetical protein